MDFTLKTYRHLLQSLQKAGFSFLTFAEYIESEKLKVKSKKKGSEKLKTKSEKQGSEKFKVKSEKLEDRSKTGDRRPDTFQLSPSRFIILRHDVDLLPQNSLAFARIQHSMGIKGSYYFRAVPESWDEVIIKGIASMGHEIGYHYENMTTCNGDLNQAIHDFEFQLQNLRYLAPVTTICMHGSPRSRWDSRDMWQQYNYRDFGIIGEPYFDMDFDNVFYLTDTGRRWDGWKVSVRDKVPQQERWVEEGLVFRSTGEIIKRVESSKLEVVSGLSEEQSQVKEKETRGQREKGTKRKGDKEPMGVGVKRGGFPDRVMFTFHPQRWTDRAVPWLRELVMQNLKNVVKGVMVGKKG